MARPLAPCAQPLVRSSVRASPPKPKPKPKCINVYFWGCYYHQHTPAPLPGWGTIARAATLYLVPVQNYTWRAPLLGTPFGALRPAACPQLRSRFPSGPAQRSAATRRVTRVKHCCCCYACPVHTCIEIVRRTPSATLAALRVLATPSLARRLRLSATPHPALAMQCAPAYARPRHSQSSPPPVWTSLQIAPSATITVPRIVDPSPCLVRRLQRLPTITKPVLPTMVRHHLRAPPQCASPSTHCMGTISNSHRQPQRQRTTGWVHVCTPLRCPPACRLRPTPRSEDRGEPPQRRPLSVPLYLDWARHPQNPLTVAQRPPGALHIFL